MSELITPHDQFQNLGKTDDQRFSAYKRLFDEPLSHVKVDQIRLATHRGLVVGSDEFKDKIEMILGESVRPRPVGRPWQVEDEPVLYF
ncbi:MAG: hypothetical protein OQK51_24685 [Kangiellaceae bacterium]|nr:hypothetical protein [Kangiellaceae bacterium]